MQVVLSEEYDADTVAETMSVCQHRFGDSVGLADALPSFRFDLGAISSVVGLLIGVISLCLQLHARHRSGHKGSTIKTNADASRYIHSEIKSIEIHTFTEIKVEHVRNLTIMNDMPCVVDAREDNSDSFYRISVRLSETTCTISNESSHERK